MPLFQPLYVGRLVRLAAPAPEDRDIMARWTQDDQYMRLLDDDPVRPRDAGEPEEHGDSYEMHVRTLADDVMIGFVALYRLRWASGTAEMAIGIGEPAYRGRGYGSDALRLLLNYAFNELNLYRVGLSVMSYNAAAIRAYERAGFVREGAQRGVVLREGRRYDMLLYGILRDEWLNTAKD
jgi:RimJ/RimL family protein N-acetyltransferase